jgi:hypothetical protein
MDIGWLKKGWVSSGENRLVVKRFTVTSSWHITRGVQQLSLQEEVHASLSSLCSEFKEDNSLPRPEQSFLTLGKQHRKSRHMNNVDATVFKRPKIRLNLIRFASKKQIYYKNLTLVNYLFFEPMIRSGELHGTFSSGSQP